MSYAAPLTAVVAFLLAFVLAFCGTMALPGPSGVMVVTRTIEGRFAEARKIGLGAALPEATFAGLAFAGAASVLEAHPTWLPVVRSITSVVLIAVGVMFVRWKPAPVAAAAAPRRGAFRVGFLTALFNPVALVTWGTTASIIASRGLVETSFALAVPFGLGVVAGITAWYDILIRLMTRYHERVPRRFFTWLIRGIGAFLVASGSWTALGVARTLATRR